MTDEYITLLCLIEGENAANTFSVEIECTKTIGDLKKRIKSEKAPTFDDIAADELALWSVSIPVVPTSMQTPVVLNEVAGLPSPTELAPTISMALLKELPTDTIHLLVQRPPRAQSPVNVHGSGPLSAQLSEASHAATPNQLKDSRHDDVDKELATAQKEKPSPSNKRPLHSHNAAPNLCLVKLGLMLGKEAKTSDGETLCSIVEGDVGSGDEYRVVAMVAPSGSGKTATVFDLASKHFVVYFTCCSRDSDISRTFNDPNFVTLAKDVEDIYDSRANKEWMPLYDLLHLDSEVKELVVDRVQLELLARLLFLLLLFKNNADLEPQQFFHNQTTTGGAVIISRLVNLLRCCDFHTIDSMLHAAQTKLHALLSPRRRGLVVAVDDAQVAVNDILAGKLISVPASVKSCKALLDDNDQIRSKFRCGFILPLIATLSHAQATLVILGTAVSLQEADDLYSSIENEINFTKITGFPQFNEDDVNRMLSDLIDLSDCDIPPAKRRKLTGRARLSLGIIHRLFAVASVHRDTKQVILNNAIDYVIECEMSGFQTGTRALLKDDKSGDTARLLCRMVLAYHLQETSIWFSSSQQPDLVDKGLCRLRSDQCDIHLIMDEPLVVKAVEEELKALDRDFVFTEHMDQVEKIFANFGMESSPRRNTLELLVCRSLQRFNGVRLADLPFLRGVTLPSWCDDLRLHIDEINTIDNLGYNADLDFFAKCPPNKMLVAKESGSRPDGVWFFSDRQYAGSLVVNLYSEPVLNYTHEKNEASSDVRAYFLKSAGATINPPSLEDLQRSHEDSGTSSSLKGMLRIHLEFPGVQDLWNKPVTHIRRDATSGIEDIMVYIDLAHMDSFFDEGIAENRDDVIQLKKLIKFVSSSK